MAKAKKSEAKSETSKAPAKKAAKAKPAAAPAAAPMIDTGLAASAAAKSVAAFGSGSTSPASGSTPAKESASFKNLKASIANPAGNSMANLLDKTAGPGQKKSNLPFHGGKQVGRNQTFGADVNRTGVPRRTGG